MTNHNVPVAMKPCKTLKTVLVHPKDKQEKEDLTECVHKVPCANCDKTYIGETGRKFGVRLQEHKTEVASKTGRTFTRSLRASSLTEHNKSALSLSPTTQLKRTVSSTGLEWWWSTESQSILPDGSKRPYTSERKDNRPRNRDEGSYQLSHAYDRFLDTASSRHVKNQKNWVPASSDEGLWSRSKHQVLCNNFGCVWWI